MKRAVFLFLIFWSVFAGIPADEKGLNLHPVPDKLLRSLPPAIISGADDGFELPSKVDIGSSVLIARSQGGLGSCASWCVASEITRFERIRNKWPIGWNISYFSPLFLYNQVNGGVDRGSSLYSNLNILREKGCALYVTFPYIEDYRIQPSVSAYREAARYRIEEFKKLPVEVDAIKRALAQGYGIIISFHVYDNFDAYTGGIYRPRGQSGVERKGERFDYHGMLIVGYNDADKLAVILNSWGTTWGNKGYMYVSYDDLSTLIHEAYIVVPQNSLPTTAVPPPNVQAGKGSNRNKIVISWTKNGAEEYEIFRLGDNEYYTSLGKTSNNFFEDTAVVPNRKFYYFVASHKGEYMPLLSFAAEGWTNENVAEAPGIPREFSVRRQGKNIIAQWQAVENANLYQIYQFNDAIGEYILAGETTGTVFRMSMPVKNTGSVMTFFVLAKNMNGQGLPSEPAAIVIDDWKKTDEQEEHQYYEVYRGGFYNFPIQRFRAVEQRASEYFVKQKEEFNQKFKGFENRATVHFRGQQNQFKNKIQNINGRLQGGEQ